MKLNKGDKIAVTVDAVADEEMNSTDELRNVCVTLTDYDGGKRHFDVPLKNIKLVTPIEPVKGSLVKFAGGSRFFNDGGQWKYIYSNGDLSTTGQRWDYLVTTYGQQFAMATFA